MQMESQLSQAGTDVYHLVKEEKELIPKHLRERFQDNLTIPRKALFELFKSSEIKLINNQSSNQ